MRSIRLRLFIALLSTFVIAWGIAIAYLGFRFSAERSGIWDRSLRDIATQVVLSTPSDIGRVSSSKNLQLAGDPQLSEFLSNFNFQIWLKHSRELAMRAPGAPRSAMKPDFEDGYATQMMGNREWRVYALSDSLGNVQIQVARPTSEQAADLRTWIRVGLGTTLLLLIFLGAVTRWVVGRSLLPVVRLERAITRRDTLDLQPLPSQDLPAEVRPLVDAFNQLLSRLDRAVTGERQFLSDAAHELRTPLAALLTHAQVAHRSKSSEELASSLDQLMHSAKRSARLAQQLLDSARLDVERRANEQGPVELADIVSMVTREFQATAFGRRQSIMLQAEPCLIHGNVDDLGILVGNLIDNALRYTQEGGRVEVTCVRDNGVAHLAVRDNGPGVSPSERERIFDRFYRVSGTQERGSGIGLSLVERIAESHRATIVTGAGLNEQGFSIVLTFPALNDALSANVF